MMRLTREDYRHLAMVLVVWGALGGLFGFVVCQVIGTVNTPTASTVEQTQQPPHP